MEYTENNRERISTYTKDLKRRMGAFRDVLIDGTAKRQLFSQLEGIWSEIEQEFLEYQAEQEELNKLAYESVLRCRKTSDSIRSKNLRFFVWC
jgi:hypothetical protein